MATFVILPGATAGGWFMRKLATRLRTAGHDVYTPTYTGIGERAHLLSDQIDLHTHILDVCQVLKYEDLQEVILVGKSYSGMVITAVAEKEPERISHLVYLDGAVPQDGQSLADLLGEETVAQIEEVVQTYGEGWLLPGDSSVDPRMTNHPMKTAYTKIAINNPEAAKIPRTYIYCTEKSADDVSATLTAKGAELAKANGWRYRELAAGHEPERDNPDEVVGLLLELV